MTITAKQVAHFRRWRATRRARIDIKKLEKLPDHLLKDIGLTRDGIHRAIRQGRPRG